MGKVRFLEGTQAEYNTSAKSRETFYQTTDQGHVYLGDKQLDNVSVDSSLSSSSTNPVQNKIIKAELDKKALASNLTTVENSLNEFKNATNTALGNKAEASALNDYLPLTGGKLTGNLQVGDSLSLQADTGHINANYVHASWLQTRSSSKIPENYAIRFPVLNSQGWVYWADHDRAAQEIQPYLALDSELSADSTNPVANNAVTAALKDKAAKSETPILEDGIIPTKYLPGSVDDVIEYANYTTMNANTGASGFLYVTLDDNKVYRWGGSSSRYVEVSASLALGETASTAFDGARGLATYKHAVTNKGIASSGWNKLTTNTEGHVTAATPVAKADVRSIGGFDANADYTIYIEDDLAGSPDGEYVGKIIDGNSIVKALQTKASDSNLNTVSAKVNNNTTAINSINTELETIQTNLIANLGSEVQPIYFDSNGIAKKTKYTLNATVPSNAKFTDTTYSVATQSADGLLGKDDKIKLDRLNISYDSSTDTLTFN